VGVLYILLDLITMAICIQIGSRGRVVARLRGYEVA
jgi:hypothetical protein